jgi:ATP-dependent Clp protease ATP-binding subunit ClpA
MENKIDRFTPNARYILSLSEKEAERLQQTTIGTPHILLAMIRSEYGVAGIVLRELGLELNHVRETVRLSAQEKPQQNFFNQVIQQFAKVKTPPPQENSKPIELSPQVKQLLEIAVNKARRMGDHHIGTEHLLLGIAQHKECKALIILDRFGISTRVIRSKTTKFLKDHPNLSSQSDQPNPYNKIEHFTEKSRHALYFAQEEVKRLQHNSIDTQHILIGLMRVTESIASRVLQEMNVTEDQIVELCPQLSKDIDNKSLEISADTKTVLELAIAEAHRMEQVFIGTEHLLLGLTQHEKSIAFEILRQLDVSPEDIRSKIKNYI